VVTKTIAGSAAGQRGDVVLHVSCDNGLEQDITIPAEATGDTSTTIGDLPAGTVCTVTETSDGSSSTVTVTVDGAGSPVTIPAGEDTVVHVTDRYEAQAVPAGMPISPIQPNTGYPAQPNTGYPAQPDTISHVLPTTGVSNVVSGMFWVSLLLIATGIAMRFASRRGSDPR
jgi:hypothetical protein